MIILFLINFKKNKKYSKICYICNLISTIILISFIINYIINLNYYKKYSNILNLDLYGIVIDKKDNNSKEEYIIKVIDNKSKYKNDLLLVKLRNENLEVGDIVFINGRYEMGDKARNYKGFNYRNYLKGNNLQGVVNCNFVKKVKSIKHNELKVKWYKFSYNIKTYFRDIVTKNNEEKYLGFIQAIILGNKKNMDKKSIEIFNNAGLAHILAISGMHVSYVITFVYIILRKINKTFKVLISIIFLLIFSIITGNSVSIIRAIIMIFLTSISKVIHRKSDSLTNLSIAALILMIFNPYIVYNNSFTYSFLGTLGIIVFMPIFNQFIDLELINIKINNKYIFKVIKYIILSIEISISANLILFPYVVYNSNKFSISFIISSYIINFLLSFFIPIVIVTIILYITNISFIINTFNFLLYKLIDLIFYIVEIISKISLLNIQIYGFNKIMIFVYYLILIALYMKVSRKVDGKIRSFFEKITKIILISYIILSILFKLFYFLNGRINIYMIDVGQGDSTLIFTRFNNILIDGGGIENNKDEEDYIGKNVLLPYLKNRGIKRLDYIFISHFDNDHVGGVLSVLKELKVKNVVIAKQFEKTKQYSDFIKIVQDKNINVIIGIAGENIEIENDVKIQILWPTNNLIEENPLNNNSLVFKFIYKNFTMLFTGDIENKAEQELMNLYEKTDLLRCTVLKVAHHGSKTSSSNEIIQKIKPKYVLIGVGKNNKYKHPSKEIIERFEKNKIIIHRTDINGEINIKTNGENISIKDTFS